MLLIYCHRGTSLAIVTAYDRKRKQAKSFKEKLFGIMHGHHVGVCGMVLLMRCKRFNGALLEVQYHNYGWSGLAWCLAYKDLPLSLSNNEILQFAILGSLFSTFTCA